jgi:hypothetical protein
MILRNRIAFVALAALAAFPAMAQVTTAALAQRRSEVLTSALKGPAFTAGARPKYQVVVGLRAVLDEGSSPEARLAALRRPASSLVEAKGPYVLFQETVTGATSRARVAAASVVVPLDGTTSFPVVLNTQTGELGVLPGIVVVKLRDPADAASLAKENGFALEYLAEPIRYGFFRVPDLRNVIEAAAKLAADPRVEDAYPEVREHFPSPM